MNLILEPSYDRPISRPGQDPQVARKPLLSTILQIDTACQSLYRDALIKSRENQMKLDDQNFKTFILYSGCLMGAIDTLRGKDSDVELARALKEVGIDYGEFLSLRHSLRMICDTFFKNKP